MGKDSEKKTWENIMGKIYFEQKKMHIKNLQNWEKFWAWENFARGKILAWEKKSNLELAFNLPTVLIHIQV